MANNFFNFKIPRFNLKYGTDWTDFSAIIEENTDHYFEKAWQLYHLNDINKMSTRVVQAVLNVLKIPYTDADTMFTKKLRLRQWATKFINKGLGDIYLDIGEEITGTRGVLWNGAVIGIWRWGYARHNLIRWSQDQPQFVILFDVKTLDSDELDQIQSLLQDKSYRPAFHRIYLVDSSYNILRTI